MNDELVFEMIEFLEHQILLLIDVESNCCYNCEKKTALYPVLYILNQNLLRKEPEGYEYLCKLIQN